MTLRLETLGGVEALFMLPGLLFYAPRTQATNWALAVPPDNVAHSRVNLVLSVVSMVVPFEERALHRSISRNVCQI